MGGQRLLAVHRFDVFAAQPVLPAAAGEVWAGAGPVGAFPGDAPGAGVQRPHVHLTTEGHLRPGQALVLHLFFKNYWGSHLVL